MTATVVTLHESWFQQEEGRHLLTESDLIWLEVTQSMTGLWDYAIFHADPGEFDIDNAIFFNLGMRSEEEAKLEAQKIALDLLSNAKSALESP